MTTDAHIRGVHAVKWPSFDRRLWQRNTYEHVIGDEAELQRLRQYIADHPARWRDDAENPDRCPARHPRQPIGASERHLPEGGKE